MTPRHPVRRFELWAPAARDRVELDVDGARHAMRRDPDRPGWWLADAPADPGGSRYGFRLDDDPALLPDPRSPRQPQGPDGPSQLVDHDAFTWTAPAPVGRPPLGGAVYELHVGTFTPEGTFDAAAARLGHLVDLGVDTVELMPVCPFPGEHGWGYDGVSLWAVHEPYGGPDGLKRFVDAAHRHGLRVLLDVVHNHLGPSGNYLPRFGPYFTERHHTPWGAAVNLDAPGSDEVRAYLIGSALAWLRDYRLDGLRLDAVHALVDTRALHFLEELAAAVDGLAAATGRTLPLIGESDLNDPRLTTPRAEGGLGLAAQWSDDFHHCLHAALTGEAQGYYADFAVRPLHGLAKTLTRGWFHDGTWSSFRERSHGRPLDPRRTPGHRLLGYLQTHDQVGNRATGDRISAALGPGPLAAGAALVLTSPFTPMLFMGEEWGARTPWQYFTDHQDPELARAVREGRRGEFADHGWAPEDVPDPQARETFLASKLDWAEPGRPPHAALLDWYRTLLALRRAHPALADPQLAEVGVDYDEDQRWLVLHRGRYRTAVNLADAERTVPLGAPHRSTLAAFGAQPTASGEQLTLPPGSAAVLLTAAPA
ncbi:malto-oligosyltrehalose trehalohydrolase [Streptacidiphilus sp. PB12-B1b]|uniref:malto-oligosyltrehalose trehalohydrolase n=1 Tax=Streptacidiphilus sp. PB12-B1b TaxID=2705012 RepID=UPI0015FA526B|nr:malto-oligosyltrehalose trehalohydrolase [Streptacidiphilus sp. PB12-B1b]QMU75967.1 malto-oligosyltrehalose trehalohydrolase [Streptacidiphilus sp. PB12-B1b]